MTLIKTATELKTRLQAASQEDDNEELLSRGRKVRDEIANAAYYLEGVISYRNTIGRGDAVPVNGTELHRAIGRFRTALSGDIKALQQQYAVTVSKECGSLIRRLERWVKSTWLQRLADASGLIESVEFGSLYGSDADKRRAEALVSKVRDVINTDPIRDRRSLENLLNAQGLDACLERVDELVEDLRVIINRIARSQIATPPQVRAILRRAESPFGVPLSEITPELLTSLKSSGVIDSLVVRRS